MPYANALPSSPIHARESRAAAQPVPHLTSRRQERIDHGVLIRWTKGFGAPNTEGHDVVEMFRKALAKNVRLRNALISAHFDLLRVACFCAVRTCEGGRPHVRHDRDAHCVALC